MADKLSLDSTRKWNLIYTSHANKFLRNTPTDNFYQGRPVLEFLRKKGRVIRGGDRIIEPISHGGAALGGPITSGTPFALVDHDPVTAARYDTVIYQEPVVVDRDEEWRAGGPEARLNFVQTKVMDAVQRIMDNVNQDLLATSTTSGNINAIGAAIPIDPTASGAFGGLDGAAGAQTWWRNKTDSTVTFSTGGIDAMRSMYNNVSAGGLLRPDFIFTDQATHELYEDATDALHALRSPTGSGKSRVGDVGLGGGLMYKGTPVEWDANAPSGRMYFLNSKAIQLLEAPKAFTIEPFESMITNGHYARGTIVTYRGQLVVNNRRALGQIDAIS